MTNNVSCFIWDYTDIVAPLHEITHKGEEFKKEKAIKQALDNLKWSLASDDVID